MELAQESLGNYLYKRQYAPLPNLQILQILEAICLGLNFLHMCNIVHHDVQPENVLIMHTGDIKLADFGLARELVIVVLIS
jgi:serine/threonine-protein kinase